MKFKEYFLSESNEFESFLKKIKHDSSDFIKQVEKPLWRGVRKSLTFGQIETSEERQPRDSGNDLYFNNCFNIGMEKITGEMLIRKKSLFCSNAFHQTVQYGRPHFIFPINGCKYLFSNIVYDSYEDTYFTREHNQHKNLFNELPKSIEKAFYNEKDLTIKKLFETVSKEKSELKIQNFIEKISETFEKEYKYNVVNDANEATNMKAGGHEIICFGVKKYYQINVEFLIKELKIRDYGSASHYQKAFSTLINKINEL